MSGFCVAKTEGHPHLCPSDTYTCGKYCKDYEQGKIAPIYPVPAIRLEVWQTIAHTTVIVTERIQDYEWQEVWRQSHA